MTFLIDTTGGNLVWQFNLIPCRVESSCKLNSLGLWVIIHVVDPLMSC